MLPMQPLSELKLATKGWLAICSRGKIGLILEDTKKRVTYPDGTQGDAYVGVCLMDGEPWSSRNPLMLGKFLDLMCSNKNWTEWFAAKIGKVTRNSDEVKRLAGA